MCKLLKNCSRVCDTPLKCVDCIEQAERINVPVLIGNVSSWSAFLSICWLHFYQVPSLHSARSQNGSAWWYGKPCVFSVSLEAIQMLTSVRGLWVACFLFLTRDFFPGLFLWSPVDSWGYSAEPAGGPGRGDAVLPPLVLACHGLDLPVHFLPRPRGNCQHASVSRRRGAGPPFSSISCWKDPYTRCPETWTGPV